MSQDSRLAEAVRDACLNAALTAYEDAGISGLCLEGRREMAVQAIRTVDLARRIPRADVAPDSQSLSPTADLRHQRNRQLRGGPR